MKRIHETIDKALVFIETNIPTVMLIGVFLGFIISIGNRHLLQAGSPKVDEAYVVCFCWLAVFSSPLATRNEEHVAFTILYDALSDKGKAIMDVVGKVILLALLIVIFMPSVKEVSFQAMNRTSNLHLKYSILYAPFMFFLTATIYHQIALIVRDVKTLIRVFKAEPEAEKEGE